MGGAKLFRAEPRELTLKAGVTVGGKVLLVKDSTSRVGGSSWVFDLVTSGNFRLKKNHKIEFEYRKIIDQVVS